MSLRERRGWRIDLMKAVDESEYKRGCKLSTCATWYFQYVYTKQPAEWQAGKHYYGGSTNEAPDDPGQKVLRAIDVKTGAVAWELPQAGAARSWGGTLATAGGLVFFGEDSGALMAVDASSGTIGHKLASRSSRGTTACP